MTEWEYLAFTAGHEPFHIIRDLNRLGAEGWELVGFHDDATYLKRPKPSIATSLVLTIQGATMATTFTVDDTTATATLQFTDDHSDPVAGPVDSVTAAPIVPVVTSDTTTVLTVAEGVASATPGAYTYALTPVAVGTANVGVSPLVNSDGSPVNETVGPNVGQPFSVPAAVPVDVTAGAATGLAISTSA